MDWTYQPLDKSYNLSFQKLHRKIRGEARTPLPISTMIPEGLLQGVHPGVAEVSGEAGEAGRVAVQDLPGATWYEVQAGAAGLINP